MRRRLLGVIGLILALAVAAYAAAWGLGARPEEAALRWVAGARPPIVVGLLHSQSGPMAISEKSLVDAEVLAVEEVNARGGVAGRLLEVRVGDGRSDPQAFEAEAGRLIVDEGASVLFGTYSSESRKAVMAVVEGRRGLLFVPGNFEGMERSPRLIYAGGSANQSVIPAVRWAVDALKARRFFVVGSQEIWSRSVAEIAKDAVKAAGGELAGEAYLPMGGSDVGAIVGAIRAARPDVVLSSLLGDSNPPFYAALHREGLAPEKLPVVSYTVGEDELRDISPADAIGHFSAWNHFQSVPRPENRDFVRRFKARFGEGRVVSDPIVAAYNAVTLWAQTVADLGSVDPTEVLEHLGRQSLNAPDSIVTVDPESHVFWRPFHVGRARSDGQFDVVWSIAKPIRPVTYVGTRSKEQWQDFQAALREGWRGRWSSTESPGPAAPAPDPGPPPPSPPGPGEIPVPK